MLHTRISHVMYPVVILVHTKRQINSVCFNIQVKQSETLAPANLPMLVTFLIGRYNYPFT